MGTDRYGGWQIWLWHRPAGDWHKNRRIQVAANGMRVANYDENPIAAHMQTASIDVAVSVGAGVGMATVYSCDLTHDYISINADYRS